MQPKSSSLPSISELLSEAFTFFKAAWQVFAPIALVMSAGTILTGLFLVLGIEKDNIIMGLLNLVGLVLSIWGSAAILYALKQYVEGNHNLQVVDVYKNAVPYILPVFGTGLIVGIMVILGLILLIIPGIIVAVWGFAASYVVMFENMKYFEAFKRSKDLVSGHWFDVAVRLFVLIVVVLLINFVTAVIPVVSHIVSAIVIVPFTTFYSYLLYVKLKETKSISAPKA